MKAPKPFPRGKREWLRFAFYALETLVVGMAARVVKLNFPDYFLQFPRPFYIVYYSAFFLLLLVSNQIKTFYPRHARLGIATCWLSLWFYLPFNVGMLLCFILSPLSGLPRPVRYRCALIFSLLEALGSPFMFPFTHYASERIPLDVNAMFGFIFAVVRVTMSPRCLSPAGWALSVCLGWSLFHALRVDYF